MKKWDVYMIVTVQAEDKLNAELTAMNSVTWNADSWVVTDVYEAADTQMELPLGN